MPPWRRRRSRRGCGGQVGLGVGPGCRTPRCSRPRRRDAGTSPQEFEPVLHLRRRHERSRCGLARVGSHAPPRGPSSSTFRTVQAIAGTRALVVHFRLIAVDRSETFGFDTHRSRSIGRGRRRPIANWQVKRLPVTETVAAAVGLPNRTVEIAVEGPAPTTQGAPPKRGSDLRFRWWRGWDLNPRPSGYEPSDRRFIPSQRVPDRALEQRFRGSDYPSRAVACRPAMRRTVEGTVEVSPPFTPSTRSRLLVGLPGAVGCDRVQRLLVRRHPQTSGQRGRTTDSSMKMLSSAKSDFHPSTSILSAIA